jgi:hypothetical protein
MNRSPVTTYLITFLTCIDPEMQSGSYDDERDDEDGGPNDLYRTYDEVRDPGESCDEYQLHLQLPPRVRVTSPQSRERL